MKPPRFDAVIAPFVYAPPLDMLIKRFKYRDGWQLAAFLASLVPPLPEADIVLPVPLHSKRQRQRGFNQSHEIAKRLCPAPNDRLMIRHRNNPPQASIHDPEKRLSNVRGNFRLRKPVSGKSLIVVDDVMTSGATANEIASVLKEAGARRVVVCVVARTEGQSLPI